MPLTAFVRSKIDSQPLLVSGQVTRVRVEEDEEAAEEEDNLIDDEMDVRMTTCPILNWETVPADGTIWVCGFFFLDLVFLHSYRFNAAVDGGFLSSTRFLDSLSLLTVGANRLCLVSPREASGSLSPVLLRVVVHPAADGAAVSDLAPPARHLAGGAADQDR